MMKKFFYLIATAAVLTTNPLMAMNDDSFTGTHYTITARQFSDWINDPSDRKELERVVYKFISNGMWASVEIDTYAKAYLPQKSSESYLPLNCFSKDLLRETITRKKENPEITLDPTQEIVFAKNDFRHPYYSTPYPGYESEELSPYSCFCKLSIYTVDQVFAIEKSIEDDNNKYSLQEWK